MLTPRQDQIMTYIIQNPKCTSTDIANALGIQARSVRIHLRQLIKMQASILSAEPGDYKNGRPSNLYSVKPLPTNGESPW